MKKLVLFVAIVATVTFASCSSKTQEAAPAEPTTVESTQETAPVQETVPADTTAATQTPTEAPVAK